MAEWSAPQEGEWQFGDSRDRLKTDDPYVHWHYRGYSEHNNDLGVDFDFPRLKWFDTNLWQSLGAATRIGNLEAGLYTGAMSQSYADSAAAPYVAGTRNPDFDTGRPPRDRSDLSVTTSQMTTSIHGNTVIVGIVDTGISLAHRQFRFKDGKTRFISFWQQSAPYYAKATTRNICRTVRSSWKARLTRRYRSIRHGG